MSTSGQPRLCCWLFAVAHANAIDKERLHAWANWRGSKMNLRVCAHGGEKEPGGGGIRANPHPPSDLEPGQKENRL